MIADRLDIALTLTARRGWAVFPLNLNKMPGRDSHGLKDASTDPDVIRDLWRRWRPRIMRTRCYRTKSGGLHCYFRHAEGIRNSASRIAKGVDVRGDGGQIVFWFGAGLDCLDQAEPAAWPDWLRTLALPPPPNPLPPANPIRAGRFQRLSTKQRYCLNEICARVLRVRRPA